VILGRRKLNLDSFLLLSKVSSFLEKVMRVCLLHPVSLQLYLYLKILNFMRQSVNLA